MDTDVLVIGGGPVGETLLNLLGAQGISAIGIEKDSGVWPRPRAVHFAGETIRTFQSIGLGEAVAEVTVPMSHFRIENEAGQVLVRADSIGVGEQAWVDSNMFHQPEVDALLRTALERYPNIELLTGCTVESLTQTDDDVTAVVVDQQGVSRQYTARYLIGCDGASSTVRSAIGAHYDELGPSDPWLVVDGIFREDPAESSSMVFFGHHSRPHAWAALPGLRRRMEFKVLPDDDTSTLGTPEWVAEASRGLMTTENFSIDRTVVYTFRSCLSSRWRDGRVFLAGDAAHLMPPFLGQGLCSGIRDAQNIAWKLRLVLDGGDESILDSYESERKQQMRQWIEHVTRASGFMQTTDAEMAAQRDAHILAHPEQTQSVSHPLGSGLSGTTAPAGLISIQPQVAEGRFDDGIGHRFLIAATEDLLGALPDQTRQALDMADSLVVVRDVNSPGVAELLEWAGTAAIVLRPDRYVLDVAVNEHGLDAVIRRVLELGGVRTSASV